MSLKRSSLSFATALRFSLKGKWVIRALTIFLCACCFASVALSSTRFAYNRIRVYTDIVYHSFSGENSGLYTSFPYFQYYARHEPFVAGRSDLGAIPQRYVDLIEERVQLPFLYYYQGGSGFNSISSLLAGAPIFYSLGNEAYTEELRMYNSVQSGVCASFDLLNELGYTVEAGRMPENEYEIAVTRAQYETFRKYNYADNTHLMDAVLRKEIEYPEGITGVDGSEYIHPDGTPVSGDYYVLETYYLHGLYEADGYWFRYNEKDPAWQPKQEIPIETYDDLLGKEVILFGDPEEGVITFSDYYKAKIVGIVEPPEDLLGADQAVVYWPGFQERMCEGYPYVSRMVTMPFPSWEYAKQCVEATLAIFDDYLTRFSDSLIDLSNIGMIGLPSYAVQEFPRDIDVTYKNSGLLVGDIFLGLSIFFSIFSIILCWYLMTASLRFKKRTLGVLRSIGAGERCIVQIALTEILFLSVCIFLLALVLTIGLYFGFLNAPTAAWYIAFSDPHPTRFILTGWTFLILFVLSFAVPLLCSVVPLRKFLKKSIVDNISGNIKAR